MNQSNVIIFNGESDHTIGKEFFFQDPQIQDLSPTEIVGLYHSTTVYYDVLKDIGSLILEGVVKHVNDTKVDETYMLQVEEGLSLLELMVNDTFGKEAAAMIFKQAQDTLSDNKSTD